MSKAKREEFERIAQVTGSSLYDYLQVKDSMPITQKLTAFLLRNGFTLQTIGQTNFKAHCNHLRLSNGNENIFLTINNAGQI